MCCILEVGLMIWGIVVLATGKFMLTRSRVVVGAPAYVIGAVLTATLPIIAGIGVVIGVMLAAKLGRPPTLEDMQPYAFIDAVGVLLSLTITAILALTFGGPPPPPVQMYDEFGRPVDQHGRPLQDYPPPPAPPESGNPYQPPHDPFK